MSPKRFGKPTTSHNRRTVNYPKPVKSVLYSDADRARFWANVEESATGCWLWMGPVNPQTGYGQVSVTPREGVPQYARAHRMAWALAHDAPIPDGQHVLHACDVQRCVHPAHLFLGSHRNNMEDAARKGRLHVPRPRRQKLTGAQVSQIRQRVASGTLQTALAHEYGVTKSCISQLVRGRRRLYDGRVSA